MSPRKRMALFGLFVVPTCVRHDPSIFDADAGVALMPNAQIMGPSMHRVL